MEGLGETECVCWFVACRGVGPPTPTAHPNLTKNCSFEKTDLDVCLRNMPAH